MRLASCIPFLKLYCELCGYSVQLFHPFRPSPTLALPLHPFTFLPSPLLTLLFCLPPPPPFVLMRNFLRVNTNLPCYSREATISNIAHWKSCPKYFGFFFIPLNNKKMITLNKLGLLKCSKLVENL